MFLQTLTIFIISLILQDHPVCGVGKREFGLSSFLFQTLLNKSRYVNTNNEYARVTQAPLIKIRLLKTKLPRSFHQSLKEPLEDVRLERANQIDHSNSQKNEAMDAAEKILTELQDTEMTPLAALTAHNFPENELEENGIEFEGPRAQHRRLALDDSPLEVR